MSFARRLFSYNRRYSLSLVSVVLSNVPCTAYSFPSASVVSSSSSSAVSHFLQHTSTTASRRTTTTRNYSTTNPAEATTNNNIIMNITDLHTWREGQQLAIRNCILPLSFDSHKGSSGRVGVLGGSAQYTGAPYYAATASLKAGADLSYIFCAEEACVPIKSYSPELMVAPVYSATEFDTYLQDNQEGEEKCKDNDEKDKLVDAMVEKVTSKIDNLHALVVGPGMGRCPLVCEATAKIIEYAKSKGLALILDADALWMISQPKYRSLFQDYTKAPVILTPNVVEYKRLLNNEEEDSSGAPSPKTLLQHTTIVRKGRHDSIVQNDKEIISCQEEGEKKRSGGIGDILSGTLGTLVAWHVIQSSSHDESSEQLLEPSERLALACWTGCCFVKHATKLAFLDKKRSMTAPDILEELGPAVNEMTKED